MVPGAYMGLGDGCAFRMGLSRTINPAFVSQKRSVARPLYSGMPGGSRFELRKVGHVSGAAQRL